MPGMGLICCSLIIIERLGFSGRIDGLLAQAEIQRPQGSLSRNGSLRQGDSLGRAKGKETPSGEAACAQATLQPRTTRDLLEALMLG